MQTPPRSPAQLPSPQLLIDDFDEFPREPAICLEDTSSSETEEPHPIPWGRFIPILLFRVSDAIVFSVIFPMITDMITSFNVAPGRIGLYSGLGEGILELVEALVATTWARLADRYGRRPCLLIGFSVIVGSAIAVGFSRGVWSVIFWRAAFGLNPCGVISRIQVGEISHASNRARIYSIFSPSFSGGVMIGAFVGGQFTHPYGRLPWYLGGTAEIWKTFPYALPCTISGAFGVSSIIYSYFFLVETRPASLVPQKEETHAVHPRATVSAALRVPNFLLVTFIFSVFQFLCFAWDGMYTVITYTKVERGGFGLPVTSIGLLYSLGSFGFIALTPLLLPKLTKRFGNTRALLYVFLSWPVLVMTVPLAQYTAVGSRGAMWAVLVFQLFLKDFGNFAWPMCEFLGMNNFDEYPDLLATGSAISLMGGSLGRAAGPAVSGLLYSISTQFSAGTLGRQMPWLCLLMVCIPPIALVRLIPRDQPDRIKRDDYEALPMMEEDDPRLSDDDGSIDDRDIAKGRTTSMDI